MEDYVVKALAFDKHVRIYAAKSTNLVEEARKIHGLWPTATAALGRTLTCVAMMSVNYKSNEHLTVKFEIDGPLGQILVEACNGNVRGLVDNPEVFLQYSDGHLAVGKAVGNGYLHVIKDLNMKQPFSSSVQIQTGEIGDDFTYYFTESEQTPSSVGLGVLVETDNSCKAAGGFILQLMPDCPDDIITQIENNLANIKPISQMINEGYTPEMIIGELTNGSFEVVGKNKIAYSCPCNKDRFFRGIKSLGAKEITDIIAEDGKASVTCRFCKKTYEFGVDDLNKMLKQIKENK
ncbi:MAG: Hsp33 family molecular chaperone HslO [Anaeroplasmataceae bacterium]